MMVEKNYKVMTMKFEYLEDTDVMDCYQKAGNAVGNNSEGVEGMMHQIEYSVTTLFVVIFGLAIMGTMNVWIMLGMIVLAFANFFIKNRTNRYTKKTIWDPLASRTITMHARITTAITTFDKSIIYSSLPAGFPFPRLLIRIVYHLILFVKYILHKSSQT